MYILASYLVWQSLMNTYLRFKIHGVWGDNVNIEIGIQNLMIMLITLPEILDTYISFSVQIKTFESVCMRCKFKMVILK